MCLNLLYKLFLCLRCSVLCFCFISGDVLHRYMSAVSYFILCCCFNIIYIYICQSKNPENVSILFIPVYKVEIKTKNGNNAFSKSCHGDRLVCLIESANHDAGGGICRNMGENTVRRFFHFRKYAHAQYRGHFRVLVSKVTVRR